MIILLTATLVLAILTGFIIYKYLQKKSRAKALVRQQEHQGYTNYLVVNEANINHAVKQYLAFTDRFCSWTDLNERRDAIAKQLSPIAIPKGYDSQHPAHRDYLQIQQFLKKADSLRQEHNNRFVKQEAKRCDRYFRTLLSNPLDSQQIDAILHDDDNTLVIAGAGCGKTTTVQGKVNYVLNNGLATPKEILLLSFAKKNADDLKEKLGHLGVECRTFHSLAYSIIKNSERAPDVIPPEDAEQLIKQAHLSLIKDGSYLASFNDMVLNGLRPIKHENEFATYKEYIEYLKDSEFESLKGMLSKKQFHANRGKKTMRSEFVKSGEECYIANFLFLNGVEYSYESPYLFHKEIDDSIAYDKHKKRYRPDFTIYRNGYNEDTIRSCTNPQEHILYLEHYGIDKDGNTPQFFEGTESLSPAAYYESIMDWKDGVHKKYGTTLIKSYSYEFKDRTVEENLISNLLTIGIRISPRSNEEIYRILQEAYAKEIEVIIQLVGTFIGLLKSNNKSFDELYVFNRKIFRQEPELVSRNEHLLQLIGRIYTRYTERLGQIQKVDFNDLISRAKDSLEQGKYVHPYKYIIVDEFQDISLNRYELLNALKKQSYCKLFAVGDDWQSIYRFSGSDLTLFKRFEAYFGHTVTRKIETTYRFADPMISVSSTFILKNPNQAKKKLRSGRSTETDVIFDYSKQEELSINQSILDLLQSLYVQYGDNLAGKSITLLGRYNHDIRQLVSDQQFVVHEDKGYARVKTVLEHIEKDKQGNIVRRNKLQLDAKLEFMTVHRAKGLESDIVILINCETGKYGFPAELSDDKILNLLLSGDDQYPNGEERRAFYVALTRAREKFVFLANKNRQSKFVREIYTDHVGIQAEAMACERCEAELRFIKDIRNKFGLTKMFGCTNFKYGCDYSIFVKEADSDAQVAIG